MLFYIKGTIEPVLKNVARRIEEEILAVLKAGGVNTQIRFNPKFELM